MASPSSAASPPGLPPPLVLVFRYYCAFGHTSANKDEEKLLGERGAARWSSVVTGRCRSPSCCVRGAWCGMAWDVARGRQC
jgi:hypothetical protein